MNYEVKVMIIWLDTLLIGYYQELLLKKKYVI